MSKWGSITGAAALAVGAGALSYVLLSPAVWTRTELDLLPLAVGMLGVGALRSEFEEAPASRGLTTRIVRICCMTIWATAVGIVLIVLMGALANGSILGSPEQIYVMGVSGLIVAGGIAWLASSPNVRSPAPRNARHQSERAC